MSWLETKLRERFEEINPELARSIQGKVREMVGLSGERSVFVKYAEWRNEDPFAVNPRSHNELRRVDVFVPELTPKQLEYTTTETHGYTASLDNYVYSQRVRIYSRTFVASPTQPFFEKNIAKHYLQQQYAPTSAVNYGMRYLAELQREHARSPRASGR